MNKQEIDYLKRQIENELAFYNACLAALEKIEISPINKRAAHVVNLIIQNKYIIEKRLEGL